MLQDASLEELRKLAELAELSEQTKQSGREADFGRRIRGLVRGLWAGEIDEFAFVDSMITIVERGITWAWEEGASVCGISPADFSGEERQRIQLRVAETYSPVVNFAGEIVRGNRATGGKLRTHLNRAAMWSNRYAAVKHEAQLLACADQKLMWVWNPMKEHCSDCENYNGRVYRASVWAKYNIQPQMRALQCGGWRCGCNLTPTNDPVTPGRPPSPFG